MNLGASGEIHRVPSAQQSNDQIVVLNTPKIYQEKDVQKRLEPFREDYCDISSKGMEKYILEGERLENLLADSNTLPEVLEKEATPEAAVALMWLLTAKVAKYDQLYTSGGIRLAEGEKVRDFLKACGKGQIYGRISTHFKENITSDNPQYGFDLRGKELPAKKNTVLFALQPDGSLFIKMEKSGCPPFWKKGFRSFANFMEFVRHGMDFVRTRFVEEPGIKAKRKEHVPKKIQKEFRTTMETLFPPGKQSFFSRLFSKKKISPEGKKFYEEGVKRGKTKMKGILDEKIVSQGTAEEIAKTKMLKELENFNRPPELYVGEVKGEEVLIPPLGK